MAVATRIGAFAAKRTDVIVITERSNGALAQHVSFVPGFATPQWALDEITLQANFCIEYGFVPFVAKAGDSSALPMPWDTTYQALWSNFLQQVSLRYASNPQFNMIAAAGPTSISEEMSLPGAGVPDNCTAANQTTWEAQMPKYSPEKYVASWNSVFSTYASFFPGQFVSLAVYPGLVYPGLASKYAPYPKTDTPRLVIGAGTATPSLMLAVEANGLTPASPGSLTYDLVKSSIGKTSTVGKLATGFEFATSALLNPAKQGDAEDPTNSLCLSLQTGLNAGVDYLEIYEEDAVNPDPSVQALLQTAANQLLSPPGTSRSPLPCPHSKNSAGTVRRNPQHLPVAGAQPGDECGAYCPHWSRVMQRRRFFGG